MKIKLTFKGLFTGETKVVVVDDMVSPTGGYGLAYRERVGASYPVERLGDKDRWVCEHTEYLRGKAR